MLECFDKERVCDSQDHVWSRERKRKGGKEARQEGQGPGGAGGWGQRRGGGGGQGWCLRGLRARGELLELAVVDGEVGAVITAELEGLQAAAGGGAVGQ